MNTAILQKCVDELKKEKPNVAYILGTLETLIEMSGGAPSSLQFSSNTPNFPLPVSNGVPIIRTESISDEEIIPAFAKPGPIANLS